MGGEGIPFSQKSIRQRTEGMSAELKADYLSSMTGREIGSQVVTDSNRAQEEAEEMEGIREQILSNTPQEAENLSAEEDKEAIGEAIDFYTQKYPSITSKDIEDIRRIYGALRRTGLNPEEAKAKTIDESEGAMEERTKLAEVLHTHSVGAEKKRKNIEYDRQKSTIKEELDYQETIENPEDYFYHSSNAMLNDFVSFGLKHSPGQSNDYESPIDFWNGTQELHEGLMEAWHSYGMGKTLLRVKKNVLEDLGFKLEPFSSKSPATRAWKVNPAIPPGDLEIWDRNYRLWRPLLDVAKEQEDNR